MSYLLDHALIFSTYLVLNSKRCTIFSILHRKKLLFSSSLLPCSKLHTMRQQNSTTRSTPTVSTAARCIHVCPTIRHAALLCGSVSIYRRSGDPPSADPWYRHVGEVSDDPGPVSIRSPRWRTALFLLVLAPLGQLDTSDTSVVIYLSLPPRQPSVPPPPSTFHPPQLYCQDLGHSVRHTGVYRFQLSVAGNIKF